jgi:uncharacterized integral membrane protein (TIGR00698 family)
MRVVPGALVASGAAIFGWGIETLTNFRGVGVLCAVITGLILGNVAGLNRAPYADGTEFVVTHFLRWAVVLLGTQLALREVIRHGASGLALIFTAMLVVGAVVAIGGRLTHLPGQLTVLIGVGMSICGNTAIAATAPAIKAKPRDVSTAVAAVTGYGTVALLLFPIVARGLDLPDDLAGMWIGVAVNDTSQVIGASAAVSDRAMDVATVVKLIRNVFIAPVVIAAGVVYARRQQKGSAAEGLRGYALLRSSIPAFVVLFVAAVTLRTLEVLPTMVVLAASLASKALIFVALAGVGLQTDLKAVRSAGYRPFAVGLVAAGLMAVVALLAVRHGYFGLGSGVR